MKGAPAFQPAQRRALLGAATSVLLLLLALPVQAGPTHGVDGDSGEVPAVQARAADGPKDTKPGQGGFPSLPDPLGGLLGVAFLTRLPTGRALENKNRQKLYSYIQEAPGTTFREILRETDMPSGTARHHLDVMTRSEMIVEHRHRSTLRYFENHGMFDDDWHVVVFLREPELAKVHAWVRDNPDEFQKSLLEHAESVWGWHRSTTQHRLARLVDAGLVRYRQAGRRKFYSVVDASPST